MCACVCVHVCVCVCVCVCAYKFRYSVDDAFDEWSSAPQLTTCNELTCLSRTPLEFHHQASYVRTLCMHA